MFAFLQPLWETADDLDLHQSKRLRPLNSRSLLLLLTLGHSLSTTERARDRATIILQLQTRLVSTTNEPGTHTPTPFTTTEQSCFVRRL